MYMPTSITELFSWTAVSGVTVIVFMGFCDLVANVIEYFFDRGEDNPESSGPSIFPI
jgi:hypothetical protein